MEINNQDKTSAKNITEIWLNNISENLLLMERLERSFRTGIDSLKELSDLFNSVIDRKLRTEYYREGSIKTAEMFLSVAESTLTNCQGFISDAIFEELQIELKKYKDIFYIPNYLCYYGSEINILGFEMDVLQFSSNWKPFISFLALFRHKLVKILSPILFTNLNTKKKNLEI